MTLLGLFAGLQRLRFGLTDRAVDADAHFTFPSLSLPGSNDGGGHGGGSDGGVNGLLGGCKNGLPFHLVQAGSAGAAAGGAGAGADGRWWRRGLFLDVVGRKYFDLGGSGDGVPFPPPVFQ